MTERYTYDADSEALWERFDDDGELIERRTTEYENGRIVRETLEDTHSDDVITTYEYDDDGNEIHITTTAGTFIRETFKLYDAEGRLSVAAMGDVVEEYRSPNSRFGGGIEYYRNASTTWFEYE